MPCELDTTCSNLRSKQSTSFEMRRIVVFGDNDLSAWIGGLDSFIIREQLLLKDFEGVLDEVQASFIT